MEMTLKDYYQALPKPKAPKTEFVVRIAERCNVTQSTVRLWVGEKVKPDNPDHWDILSEETGIPKEKLFKG